MIPPILSAQFTLNFKGNIVTAVVGRIFHFGYAQRPEIVEYQNPHARASFRMAA